MAEISALTTGRSVKSGSVKVTVPVTVSTVVLPVPIRSVISPPLEVMVGLSLVPVITIVNGTKVVSLFGAKLLSTRAR